LKTLIFSIFGEKPLATEIKRKLNLNSGEIILHEFPDSEIFIKIVTEVKGSRIIIIDSLEYPNSKILPLLFFISTARELGAKNIGMVAPYLSYMRQDKRFSSGEAITSNYFAKLLSQNLDWLITVEPHLHRHKNMQEIYSIPTTIVHATESIVSWIKTKVQTPLLIGPDQESSQWVGSIAKELNAPSIILEKKRLGDRNVDVILPDLSEFKSLNPVIVDDIVSTAHTMIITVKKLCDAKMQPPVCIAVHPLFVDNSYHELQSAGAGQIISCNTIVHPSNAIDLSDNVVQALAKYQ
jgi:ribose-phosphate pyrophosphokinase